MSERFIPIIESVDTGAVIEYAGNSRHHSEEQISQIAASIREFGFVKPILIRQDNTLIAGHGALAAAKKLGLERIPAVRCGHLTDAQAKALVIVDNRLAELSEWNKDVLRVELEGLKELDVDLDLLGFDDDELDSLLGGETQEIEDDGADSANNPDELRFRGYRIEVSKEEAKRLEELLAEYGDLRGSLMGFVGWLCSGDKGEE